MEIKEILVISGKGGTGKTSISSSLVPYFNNLIIADCDVDAPNLKILFNPTEVSEEKFFGMKKAFLDRDKCIDCVQCYKVCKFDAIDNPKKCEGCGACEYICPVNAITMKENHSGNIYVSETKYGKMVHATLFPGEENSGKLVSQVRKKAKELAKSSNSEYIILDGAPGIACNVISSLTGVKKVVIVTEPTLSGLHDLERVITLVEGFRLRPYFIINKYDLSSEISEQIEKFIREKGYEVDVKIPFDKQIMEAIKTKDIPSIKARDIFKNCGFENLVTKLKS